MVLAEWTALVASLAAILAWVAKLRWSREFSAAKDEIIRTKEAQIELLREQIAALREMSPIKLREYYLSVKEQLEEHVELLQRQIGEKDARLGQLTNEVALAQKSAESALAASPVAELEAERRSVSQLLTGLRAEFAESSDAVTAWRRLEPSLHGAILKTWKPRSTTISVDDDDRVHVDWADPTLPKLNTPPQNTPPPATGEGNR